MDSLYEEVSGLDVFIRMFDGEVVQYFAGEKWSEANPFNWSVSNLKDGDFKFRVKRPTLKINVEIPKPFTPKHGEEYWYVCSSATEKVNNTVYGGLGVDKTNQMLGCYKTKEDALLVFQTLSKAVLGENN